MAAAQQLMRSLSPSSPMAPPAWRGRMDSPYRLGPALATGLSAVEVSVWNERSTRQMNNVLGWLKGHREPERVVVLGASRGTLGGGPGASTVTAGAAALLEIARTLTNMSLHAGVGLARSVLFASWDGGQFGAVGATEWLEVHLSSLQSRAVAYFDLDGIMLGSEELRVQASPLLAELIHEAIEKVPLAKQNIVGTQEDWPSSLRFPFNRDTSMYAFLAMAGIP
ncbi:transferrin receptor protein 2-like [Petromyzon marinus]|uniref:transferrin receptor protein 2-like n=1 Tax=Petromyzon marinus TaxID=7757 RepID=UPI003F710B9D